MPSWNTSPWSLRILALVLVLLGVPAALSVSAFLQDTPIRVGEPSPRTVVAPDLIRVSDPEATERARREAAAAVTPELVDDDEARAATVEQVRDAFETARSVRAAGPDQTPPSRMEQIEALTERLPMLDAAGVRQMVTLSDSQLDRTAAEAEQMARELVSEQIREDRLDDARTRRIQSALAVRSFPQEAGDLVVAPIVRDALRPTVREDTEATEARREQAARDVQEVSRTYTRGDLIVRANEQVDELQYAALRARGLEGAEPWRTFLRTLVLILILAAAVAAYLRAYRQRVWASTRKLLLLAVLFVLFAISLELVTLLVPGDQPVWLFVLPVGALAMLATILFDPPIGVLVSLPLTAIVALTVPGEPGIVVFASVAALASVPFVSRLSARNDLRKAAGYSTLAYVALAGACAGVFMGLDVVPYALAAGLINGIATAVIVMGSLPFLESVFGILTATSLVDLADRNHPLLRELEQKALGSYNHSIMVSTLVERAARAIGADGLLGGVAALYHDIGKVRRPYFFVENQFAIANPHDELEPRVSAVIIQEHVTDGIEMARSYRLPPEVVEGIATHHGTTLVSYFYHQALEEAGGDESQVDEAHFRYKGMKPSSKEMAILMLADCCEGASRAAALQDRNLSREDLEEIVHGLVAERVEDGQLDESALTFRELKVVQESFIETLVGVYHPRIAYPRGGGEPGRDGKGNGKAAAKKASTAKKASAPKKAPAAKEARKTQKAPTAVEGARSQT